MRIKHQQFWYLKILNLSCLNNQKSTSMELIALKVMNAVFYRCAVEKVTNWIGQCQFFNEQSWVANVKVDVREPVATSSASVNEHDSVNCDLLVKLKLEPLINANSPLRMKCSLFPVFWKIPISHQFGLALFSIPKDWRSSIGDNFC